MIIDTNPYRELETNISATEFELFCLETLRVYAEKEKLNDFTIKHNQKVKADDGIYQIDVLAEYTALGTKNTILIECKKYSNSVKKEVVNALQAKLQSLGAQKGIIISTSGFQTGAVQYAEKHGIALWQVFDNYIKHISASANNQISDNIKLQLVAEKHLPKYFIMEWDYSLDYPLEQIYPTKEMQQDAWKKATKELKENQALSL